MKAKLLSLLLLFCFVFINGQITLIGNIEFNAVPLKNTNIIVKQDGKVIETFNTKFKTSFTLKLNFEKNYFIYFSNTIYQPLFLEIKADNIPKDKQDINMVHKFNVPFVLKTDDDIDTNAFKQPFCKIIFDGNSKMIMDTSYSSQFNKTVFKKNATTSLNVPIELPAIIAGQVVLSENLKLSVSNKAISIIGKNGKTIKATTTDRSGAFVFTGITPSEVETIRLNANLEGATVKLALVSSYNDTIMKTTSQADSCEWILKPLELKQLVNNQYTSNIGGKLLLAAPQQKKFFANKTIYLCNKYNTVLKKTTSNSLGAFVFEGIKPNATYFLGVDANEVTNSEKLDLLSKDDKYIHFFDTIAGNKRLLKLNSNYNNLFNAISISDDEMKMTISAKLYGDQTTTPLGKIKIVLLNENYVLIDSALTDNFGAFKFKYLPFLKRFYLSTKNADNIFDAFKNILIYTTDDKLVKIIINEKGKRFLYKPIDAEITKIKDIDIEDPWLDLMANKKASVKDKIITETILFETNKADLLPQAKEILDKVILVLTTNTSIKLEISAHTDSKGTAEDNLKLSQLRANAALNYVIAHGIDLKRIHAVGYGEKKLLNKCATNVNCSEIEHAQNRRIEFKLIEN